MNMEYFKSHILFEFAVLSKHCLPIKTAACSIELYPSILNEDISVHSLQLPELILHIKFHKSFRHTTASLNAITQNF